MACICWARVSFNLGGVGVVLIGLRVVVVLVVMVTEPILIEAVSLV